jgi:hypothetical protein
MKMTVECTPRFAKLLGVAAARRFVDWALRNNAEYQDAHEGEEHGQLTYRYPPLRPTNPDVLVQIDYDHALIVVAIDEDAIETDCPGPEELEE